MIVGDLSNMCTYLFKHFQKFELFTDISFAQIMWMFFREMVISSDFTVIHVLVIVIMSPDDWETEECIINYLF